MSTRCQIGIYSNDKVPIDNYTALIYRHSDMGRFDLPQNNRSTRGK